MVVVCLLDTAHAGCDRGCPPCPSHTTCSMPDPLHCLCSLAPGYNWADSSMTSAITIDAYCKRIVDSHATGRETSSSGFECYCQGDYKFRDQHCNLDSGACRCARIDYDAECRNSFGQHAHNAGSSSSGGTINLHCECLEGYQRVNGGPCGAIPQEHNSGDTSSGDTSHRGYDDGGPDDDEVWAGIACVAVFLCVLRCMCSVCCQKKSVGTTSAQLLQTEPRVSARTTVSQFAASAQRQASRVRPLACARSRKAPAR